MAIDPDPRTAADDTVTPGADDDATNHGVSATEPAEGDNDAPAGDGGSPR